MKFAVAIGAALVAMPVMAMPSWATRDTQVRAGDVFTVVCSGQGPSVDLARREAMTSCQGMASLQLSSETSVRAISVETELDAALHQEVRSKVVLVGLTCAPLKEEIEEREGLVEVWVKCRYDLSKVVTTTPQGDEPEKHPDQSQLRQVERRGDAAKVGQYLVGSKTTVTIATIPKCASILVRGAKPRVVQCVRNPVPLSLEIDDREAIVRADGYIPKTINLTGDQRHDHEVVLDPVD